LGTTNGWQDTKTSIDHTFSADPVKDIVFYNWNRIFVIYCDGSGHQGYIERPLNIKGKNLYFKGYNNTMTHLNWALSKLPSAKLDSFTLYGYSAGGLAMLTWLDTVKTIINNPLVKYMGLSDCGFFINYRSIKTGDNDYENRMKSLTELVNQQISLPNQKCTNANKFSPHSCIMPEKLVNYVDSPFFLSASLYDSWQIPHILQSSCLNESAPDLRKCSPSDMKIINAFKNYTAGVLQRV